MENELDEVVRTIDPVDASATEDRFVAKVELLENNCWLWHGSFSPAKSSNGYKRRALLWYGKGRKHGKMVFAHRYAYESRIGELPDQRYYALEQDCSTELCVNPEHFTLKHREVFAHRYHPNAMATIKANPLCQNGLHERTPENLIDQKIGNGKSRKLCRPCLKVSAKRSSANYYARTKAKAQEQAKD